MRPSDGHDEAAIRRLAALDSSAVPHGPLLLAEVDGELRAALSLDDGRVIADPFHLTRDVVAGLRAYATVPAWEQRPRPTGDSYRSSRLALEY